ncbi:hypothetical protein D3C87_2162680 [compost metagenome]
MGRIQRQVDVAFLGTGVARQGLAGHRSDVVEVLAVRRLLPLSVDEVVVLRLEI